jgi:hypothetical protein
LIERYASCSIAAIVRDTKMLAFSPPSDWAGAFQPKMRGLSQHENVAHCLAPSISLNSRHAPRGCAITPAA